jgi:hypothetical protein
VIKVFEEGLLKRGWITDEELGVNRVLMKQPPTRDELRCLGKLHGGSSQIREIKLIPVAYFCGEVGFVYFFFDADRYEFFDDLPTALIAASYDIPARR